jgi:hypothetical protein
VPCGIRFAVIKTFIYMYELFFFTEFVEFQVRTYWEVPTYHFGVNYIVLMIIYQVWGLYKLILMKNVRSVFKMAWDTSDKQVT